MNKIDNIRKLIKTKELDAIVITNKTTKQYLGAVTGSGSILVITLDECIQFMDGRYQNEICRIENVFNKVLPNRDYYTPIIEFFKKNNFIKIGVENEGISIRKYLLLSEKFEIHQIGEEIVKIRMIKDEEEIRKIRISCELTDQILLRVLPKIRVGMTEKELVGIIYNECFKMGADRLSFEPIVASGWRGSLPHGRPTDKVIQKGELVTIDFGIVLDHYQSDMTRTVGIEFVEKELENIYNVVQKAQQAAVDFVQPEVIASKVDEIARNIITEAGYGEFFTHGLGHGIGIGGDYPMMNASSNTVLRENMVLTCEPGIYIPKLGGVRIEDVVCVLSDRGEALTKSDKSLIMVG